MLYIDRTGQVLLAENAPNGLVLGPAQYPGEWIVSFDGETESFREPGREYETMATTAEQERKAKLKKMDEDLAVWQETVAMANKKVAEIRNQIAALNSPPPEDGVWLTMEVKFLTAPDWYRFLIMHVPGKGYYTTGTMGENQFFATWEEVLAYFSKDDVEKRTPFTALTMTNKSYGGFIDRPAL